MAVKQPIIIDSGPLRQLICASASCAARLTIRDTIALDVERYAPLIARHGWLVTTDESGTRTWCPRCRDD